MSTGMWIIEPTRASWLLLHAVCEQQSRFNVWEQELFNRLSRRSVRAHYLDPIVEAANVIFIEYAARAFANDTTSRLRPSGTLPYVLHLGYERQKIATYKRLGVYIPPSPQQIQDYDRVHAHMSAPRAVPANHIFADATINTP